MADPRATRDSARRYRDLPREVGAGTVLAIAVVTVWGSVAPSSDVVEVDPSGGRALVPILIALTGLVVGWIATHAILGRWRSNGFVPQASWIALALIAPAIAIGYAVAAIIPTTSGAIMLGSGGSHSFVGIPAGMAQWVVLWLGGFGVSYVVGHGIIGVVLSTRAIRMAGVAGKTRLP